jgi:hypothetical protein
VTSFAFPSRTSSRVSELDLRFVTSVEDPNAVGYTERSFVVENGVPGAQPA